MGSVCCVAARDAAEIPRRRTSSQGGFRSVGYSPAWNCRWDSQGGRVAEEVQYSHGTSLDFGSTTMDSIDVECGDLSERQSQVDFQTPVQQNSPGRDDIGLNSMSSPSEPSIGSGSLNEASFCLEHAKDSTGPSPVAAGPSQSSPSFPRPPTSSSSSLSNGFSHHPRHSNLRSPNNSISEERESDSWSMSTFSELVASQRERWSFDSENTDTKVTRSNITDLRTCGVCLRLLMEKSPWVAQKFMVSNELSVVAVLICGHVYHAECLDNTTPETSRFDPPCPVCTSGDKHGVKIQGKTVRIDTEFKSRNRISRNRVVDSNLGFDYSVPDHWRRDRREGKGPMLGASSSMKSSFSKPFLKRHFSLGSKSSNSKIILENEFSIKSPKKGFWSRYRKG